MSTTVYDETCSLKIHVWRNEEGNLDAIIFDLHEDASVTAAFWCSHECLRYDDDLSMHELAKSEIEWINSVLRTLGIMI